MNFKQLLKEFIRENVNVGFGLNRYVTINALKDIDNITLSSNLNDPVNYNVCHSHPDLTQVDVNTRLVITHIDESDEFKSDLDDI